jgi:UDP-N-acetylmuramoyl-L-alanyl-D-glutamate--2,6-diaminopimelate ligase
VAAELSAVARALGVSPPVGVDGVVVTDVTHDSREVGEGFVFVAIRGGHQDGHDHIGSAESRGAVAVLVDHPVVAGVPALVVDDPRAAMAVAARIVHGAPDRDLSILGVTGTNGKTTVTHLCEAAWTAAGTPGGIIGTLGARYDGVPIPLARTTPESSDMQRLLATMRDRGVRSVAIEVSSHALTLHRADAIHFTAVGFTNLTQDHLDFHGDMDAYFAAKRSLFDRDRSDVAVIDIDTAAGASIAASTDLDVVPVGFDARAAITATNLWSSPEGTTFTLVTPVGHDSVNLPLAGRFNVSNALVATGLLLQDDVPFEAIVRGLSSVAPVAGRMEVIANDGPFSVIVDYAHTPDAIATVIDSLRPATQGRLIAVIGAGGDRDAAKRPAMGAAAASRADITIVTTDNPRSEDPSHILEQVAAGALRIPAAHVRSELDRRRAISDAVDIAAPGDVVVIMGKGHEAWQELGDRTVPFDDRQVAREALRAAGWDAP